MAKQNRTTLKGYFETGDIPSQAQYADLIDSQLNLAETGIQTAAGGLTVDGNLSSSNIISSNHITASGNISASGDLSIQGFPSVSASIANLVAGGTDNLGNHIATQDLDLANNSIKNILHVTASIISASTYIGTMPTASTVTVDLNDSIDLGVIPLISNTAVSQSALISPQIKMFYDQEVTTFGTSTAKLRIGQSNPIDRPGVLELHGGPSSKGYITTFNANLQISPVDNKDLILSASGTGDITLEGNVTQSGGTVKIDYDSLPTSDPNNKGQIYRNGSNALFVSAG